MALEEHLPYLKGKEGKLGLPTPGKQEAPEANLGTGFGVVGGTLREKGREGPAGSPSAQRKHLAAIAHLLSASVPPALC